MLNRWQYLRYLSTIVFLTLFIVQSPLYSKRTPWSLLTSVVNNGDLSGGVRYKINDLVVVDGWISKGTQDTDSQVSYWADIYYGNWGLIFNGSSKSLDSSSLAYSIEKSLSDDILLGISFKVLEISKNQPNYMSGWDLYIVLPI